MGARRNATGRSGLCLLRWERLADTKKDGGCALLTETMRPTKIVRGPAVTDGARALQSREDKEEQPQMQSETQAYGVGSHPPQQPPNGVNLATVPIGAAGQRKKKPRLTRRGSVEPTERS